MASLLKSKKEKHMINQVLEDVKLKKLESKILVNVKRTIETKGSLFFVEVKMRKVKNKHIGAYGILISRGKIALINKACGGYRGKLDLPGGGIEHTETPEKALCDTLIHERYVPAQSLSALATFFEEDLRIDIDDLRQLDTRIIRACLEVGGKKKIINNLLKLIER